MAAMEMHIIVLFASQSSRRNIDNRQLEMSLCKLLAFVLDSVT